MEDSEGLAGTLKNLAKEASYWRQPCYGPNEVRLIRLEAIVEILVKALQIKGEMELEEVRRELAALDEAERRDADARGQTHIDLD